MPARRARWSGEDTRVLKAERSSWEAGLVCQGMLSSGEIISISESDAYQIFRTASLRVYETGTAMNNKIT